MRVNFNYEAASTHSLSRQSEGDGQIFAQALYWYEDFGSVRRYRKSKKLVSDFIVKFKSGV